MASRSIMQQPWDIVGVTCLIVFLGVAGIALWMRMTDRRPQWREWPHTQKVRPPKSIHDALKLLYTVTERKSQRDYQADCDDAECPICLASFSRKSEENTSRQDADADLEAGSGFPKTMMTITAGVSRLTGSAKWKKRRSLQPSDDQILRIGRCGHAFHSQCLVTWFLKEKYDCPLCRAQYYPPPKREKQPRQEEETSTGARSIITGVPPLPIF
ncbi:hypothetical protein F4824DRAFT_408546 [Ustulina deusta]|nr:hypothetical protein F4824DRAFT_408546 [Ustulina deusta]